MHVLVPTQDIALTGSERRRTGFVFSLRAGRVTDWAMGAWGMGQNVAELQLNSINSENLDSQSALHCIA